MRNNVWREIIRKEAHNYNGDIAHLARHIIEHHDDGTTHEAWRGRIRAVKREEPELFEVNAIDYESHIPSVWNGSQMDLARLMNRRFPEISTRGWEMRIARAKERNSITRLEKPDFIVENLKKASGSLESLWATIEEQSAKAIMGIEDARWSTVRINDGDRFIGISFASDQHIGNPFADHKRLRHDTELIARHPDVYTIHAGDYIDNFIIDKPRPAMKAPIPPSVQWKLCEHYIKMAGDSLIAIVAGNHDLWTAGATDYDPLKRLAEETGTLYHPYEMNIRLIHGDIPYHISVRHKRRGNSNLDPSRVIKKMWDDGEADFDIGVIGHHHTPSVVPFTKHGVERWAVRPGAYKIVDSFGEMCGFPRERPTSPIVILNPYTREIQAFTDLRHGIRLLNSLNGRAADAYLEE